MSTAERNKYKALLEAKKSELLQALRRRDGIQVESESDTFDEAQRLSERELVIHQLDRESIVLREVRAALARIDDGTYGVCLRCDDNIAPARLAAVPWASLCLGCQEEADAEAGDDSALGASMAPAA